MKIAKTIIFLLISVALSLILAIPQVLVWILQVLEAVLRIVKETLTFLIKQIKCEVLK
jgi:hypothetical protein